MFKILYGGRIRYPLNVDTTAAYTGANTWDKGNFLALQLDGTAQKVSVAADYNGTNVIGLAFDHRISAADNNTDSAGKVSMILDIAAVETDQIASGVSNFEENQTLYADSSGNVTNIDPGSGVVIGKCLEPLTTSRNYIGTRMRFLFSVQY